ncbi:protein NETWORKED 4B [Ricinus communis]|uniref:protein NETWORKED 4B n=1 Tax=Ricinus communis TaxID=3988 RepID=UPI00201A3143|nr:protein NETWORKED 4B [Ricinus communis]
MASPMVKSNRNMKRLQSRKSHSWWWDSHVSPKNSKWLAENLEEMDRSVRRMLKLIEEDGDSFAKKAEMYYQKRPELVSLVEEFYRMYRSLAERYDHVTGELRKNIPSDLQSQSSGISDIGSELTSTWPSPVPEQRLSHRKPGNRAAGFDFFLGSGGSSSDLQKEGDESSTLTDSEPESDDSSVNNYSVLLGNGGDNALSRKVIELEIELREMKDRLQMQQEDNGDGSYRGARNENFEYLLARIAGYEQELKIANQSIQHSEEEVARLNIELHRYKSLEAVNSLQKEFISSKDENVKTEDSELESEITQASKLKENTDGLEAGTVDSDSKIRALTDELRITKEKLQYAEKEIASLKLQLESNRPSEKVDNLQDQLILAHKDINTWKTRLNAEKREVSKLQERIARLRTSLSDRDHEIRDLKLAVSDAEQKIFPEKAQIKAEISKLLEERTSLDEQLREWESRCRCLEDDIRKLQTEKSETEERHYSEINQLKAETVERDCHIENLNKSLNALKLERDAFNAQVVLLKADIISRDDQINQMDNHLQQLHMEHVELIAGAEEARKLVYTLRSKANDLEKEVERQKIAITEGAEEKREAIRQLCFSLEHYRNGYHRLRKAFVEHKRLPVLVT